VYFSSPGRLSSKRTDVERDENLHYHPARAGRNIINAYKRQINEEVYVSYSCSKSRRPLDALQGEQPHPIFSIEQLSIPMHLANEHNRRGPDLSPERHNTGNKIA